MNFAWDVCLCWDTVPMRSVWSLPTESEGPCSPDSSVHIPWHYPGLLERCFCCAASQDHCSYVACHMAGWRSSATFAILAQAMTTSIDMLKIVLFTLNSDMQLLSSIN